MHHHRLLASAMLLTIVSLLSCGCGNGEIPKYPVSGTISFTGKPVEEGFIIFMNTSPTGQHASGAIQAGAFHVEAENGTYTVKIESYRETGKWITNMEEGKHKQREQYIPKKYNEESTITHDVQGAASDVKFDLTP
ncbi:MAG: hypothetical protein LC104_14860 [Bacteroidales bacterium]|nr:hypothetical protein [Bacteroidales bacterium]